MIMDQAASSQTRYAQAVMSILFIKYMAPPNIRPVGPIWFKIMNNGYEKMIANGYVQALPNSYTFSLAINTTKINSITSLMLSFDLADALTATGLIIVSIPSTAYIFPSLLSQISVSLTSSLFTAYMIATSPAHIGFYTMNQYIKSITNLT